MKFHLNCLYLLTLLGLAACGQPGRLYLPAEAPAVKANGDQQAPIPERDIDQAPPPIDTAPPKPAASTPPKDQPPTETPQ